MKRAAAAVVVLLALALALAPSSSQAQMIARAVEFDLYGGYFSFMSRGGFDGGESVKLENQRDSAALGARFGLHFTDWIGAQITFEVVPTATYDTFRRSYYVDMHGDVILHLPFPFVVPYLSVGVGFQSINIRETYAKGVGAVAEAPVRDPYPNLDERGAVRRQDIPYRYAAWDGDFLFTIGGGAKFLVHPRFGPMLDFRYILSAGEPDIPTLESPPTYRGTFHHFTATLGAFVLIGGGPGPDKDGDGIANRDDACPADPEDKDGFEDADGCPDLDNDGDGVPDVDDDCPMDMEDKDGFQDQDGCPDFDNDGDGIDDSKDECPAKPEDEDGFEDRDGCPDLDNDQDGLFDDEDECRNAPENFNSYLDDDGCPDLIPEELRDFAGVVPAIQFHAGSARLKASALPLLDRGATVLLKYPELRVEIAGHASSEGAAAANMELSQARVETVREYLISAGLPAERLVARGYGESRPVASNDSESGRARNRRVEFHLTK